MSDQEMKDIWLSADDGGRINLDLPYLIDGLKGKMKKMDRTLFFRDIREITAGIIVVGAFSYKSFTDPGIIARITSVMFVIWAFYSAYRLLRVRKHKKAIILSESFKYQLLQQKIYLEQQFHLLDSILSWHLGPFAMIYTIRIIGGAYGDPFWVLISSVGLSLGFIYLLSWGIYALNKKAARMAYLPLIDNIDRVLLQIDEETV